MARLGGSSVEGLLASSLLVTTFILLVNFTLAEDILLTVNVKKALALTSDKFLSYTLDPTAVFTGDALTKNPERSVNMARALSPAYVRIGGSESNSYTFVRSRRSENNEDGNFTITETNWIDVHRWAENAGLDLLVCIAPQYTEIGGGDSVWDSRNALDLVSFSDRMGFDTSWQLGYECQTRCDITGIENGKAVTRLRNMLDALPRYARSIVTGPDVVAFRTRQQQQYIQDYLKVAGNSLSAITWHPNFSSVRLGAESVSMHHDDLAIDRDSLYRTIGRPIWTKPLWLAESKPEECKNQFLGALVWTRRLGNAAKLGVEVIMRQPDHSDLLQPTPDYWVSVLHKSLVGPEVLDTKITNGNRSHVNFYCQCTRPSSKYEKGTLTIFGINLTPRKIAVHFRGLKNKTTHKYILMPGYDSENRMFSETVLLNNEPLNLVNDRELPEMRPAVSSNSREVVLRLPSGGIGFWVLPGLKIKSCGGSEGDSADKTLSKRSSKRLNASESDEDEAESYEVENESALPKERRHSLKSLKNRKRIHHRYSDEDDVERRFRRLEAKPDLEKLEKLHRKRDGYDRRRSSLDDDDLVDLTRQELSYGLKDYEKRLQRYKDGIEKVESRSTGKMDGITDSEKMTDSAKVVESMRSMSKMENAMELFETPDDVIGSVEFDQSAFSEAPSSPVASSSANNADDTFLGQLLKASTEKSDDVPSSTTTSSEGNLSRKRRQSDKRFGVDPLGLRKEGMYRRLGRFIEDTKERRNRRKDKEDRVSQDRKDRKTTTDSGENNFYGFHKSEPIRNFPEGDVHLTIGNSEEETPSDVHAKSNDDDEVRKVKRVTKTSRRSGRAMVEPVKDDDEWTEAEDTKSGHFPKEFFENVKMAKAPLEPKASREYSELGEAESIGQNRGSSSNAEINEAATVEKIVFERHHDDLEDRRAKESAVEKLMKYYKDSRAQTDDTIGYESTGDVPRSHATSAGPLTINDAPSSKIGRALFHLMNPAVKKKPVKDSAHCESTSLTDFQSTHFGKSTVSSLEERAFSNYEDDHKVTGESAKRTKRSAAEVLQNVLDREMIFQDDDNLKDCDCRVTRSARTTANRRETRTDKLRNPRLRKPLGVARQSVTKLSERRKNRRLEGTPASVASLDKNNSQTLKRPKRDAEVSQERVNRFVAEVPGLIYGDRRNEETSTTGETVLQAFVDATMNYVIPSLQEHSDQDSNDFANTDAEDTNVSRREQEDNGGEALALDEEMINVRIDEASATSPVKRHDKEASPRKEGTPTGDRDSPTRSSRPALSSSLKGSSKAKNDGLESTKGSNLQPFRSRKNKKEITRKLNQAKEAERTNLTDTTLLPLSETTSKSSRMLVPSATVNVPTTAAPPFVVSDETAEEATAKTAEPSTSSKKIRRKTSTMTSKVAPTISERVKAVRSKSDATALARKSPRTRTTAKPRDPVKSRGSQKITPAPDVAASRRNDERKARKSKRTEQLERLQAALREKREKLMNDHRDELSSDLRGTSDESKSLHRREAVDATMNEKEICDLVDSAKYEYLERNKPIDYDATENPQALEDSGIIGKKYVPKAVENAKPSHVTRERRVKPRRETSRATRTTDTLNSPEGTSKREGMMMERLEDDATDHKIGRRDGKTYYSLVESVENPGSLETLSYEEDFDGETSLRLDDVELDEALIDSSFAKNDRKFPQNYHRDNEDYHPISDWNNEEMRRLKIPESMRTSLKNLDLDDYVFTEETEDSSMSSEELIKFVSEDDHSNFASVDDRRAANKRKLEKKLRRLTKWKHDRLGVDQSDILSDEGPEDESTSSDSESEEASNERESKVMRRKTKSGGVESDSWIGKRMRETSLARPSATIDYADLDEMLDSGRYELLMLVPASKHRKRSRRRRHVGNLITRNEGDPVGNSITIEMMPKRRIVEKVKKAADDDISIFQINDVREIPPSFAKERNESGSIAGPIIRTIVEELKTSEIKDQKALNEYVIEGEFQSTPKILSDYRGEPNNEELSDLMEKAIPKLEATVSGGLNKVRRISESFEKLMDNLDDQFDQKQSDLDLDPLKQNEENRFSISGDAFDGAFTSMKKFFNFLSGLAHVFRTD